MSNFNTKTEHESDRRKKMLQDMLADWRSHEGLTRAQVAERMGVTPPTVSRMEANVIKAGIDTIVRYAKACGIEHPQINL